MGILDSIKEALMLGVRDFFGNLEKEFSRVLLKRVYELKKKMMRELLSMLIIVISIGMLSLSAIFFLIEYLNLNKTISFLIIGIILLMIGIFIRLIK